MWTLISNQDLKSLFQGAAGIAAGGLLLGAVMHPTLNVGERPEGPQMLLSGGGLRGGDDAADPGVSAYAGQVPDYVTGADWTRPVPTDAGVAAQADPGEAVVFTSDDDLTPTPVATASWREDPRAPVDYPSDRGGVAYEANLPPPPPAPADKADTDAG